MSNGTREKAVETTEHLRHAEGFLEKAEKSATGTGDKILIKQIETIRKTTKEVKTEITKKLVDG